MTSKPTRNEYYQSHKLVKRIAQRSVATRSSAVDEVEEEGEKYQWLFDRFFILFVRIENGKMKKKVKYFVLFWLLMISHSDTNLGLEKNGGRNM